MKKLTVTAVLAIVVSFTFFSCGGGGNDGRGDATTVGEHAWVFEGWACAPRGSKEGSPQEYCSDNSVSDNDYLYMKVAAAASDRAIASKRIAQMQATCRQAAEDQIKGNGLSKIIGDYLERASGVADGQSTGFAIVTETKGKIKGVGLYNCCSMNPKNGLCAEPGEPETWEQCMCVGYIKFPGGQDAFETRAEELEAGG